MKSTWTVTGSARGRQSQVLNPGALGVVAVKLEVRLNFSLPKREPTAEVVDLLASDGRRYQEV